MRALVDSRRVNDLVFYLSPHDDESGLSDFNVNVDVPHPCPPVLVIEVPRRAEVQPRDADLKNRDRRLTYSVPAKAKLLWGSRVVWLEEQFLVPLGDADA